MEIEIKAYSENKGKIIENLGKLGAVEEKEKHQVDEYYNHPAKDLTKINEYIRLRYKPGENKGVFAHHINIADGVNKEFEVEVGDLKTFKEMLVNLGFKMLGIIDKKRKTYSLNDFKITFDEVKDIGNFIEVETDGDETQIEKKRAECIEVLEKIGVPRSKLCKNVWLCDIATGKTKLKDALK